jgi:excisionase family DNA binding protein
VNTQTRDGAYNVTEFCAAHGISRSYFYELIARGKGPKTVKVGRRRLIPRQAAKEWLEHLAEQEA